MANNWGEKPWGQFNWGGAIPAFFYSGGTVEIPKRPVRPFAVGMTCFQPGGVDASGNRYVYSKSRIRRNSYSLTFRRIDATTKDALLQMFDTVRRAEEFTYVDHEGVSHTVMLADDVEVHEVGVGKYDIEIPLVEDELL